MKYVILDKVKRNRRLAGMPPRSVRTFIPEGWDKDSIEAYQQAATIWRMGTPWNKEKRTNS